MIKLLSLFSGIGAFEKALTNLGVQYELVNYCEIDKYASKSYSAIHGIPESKNLWDITKVNVFNLPKDIDLLTYGFPCQDISLAGKQKGMFNEDGTLTRSGLFFKALDIIECVKPKIAIAENVKALTSKKFTEEFKIVLDSLEKSGYHNYWQVLNAKDYGIPQNRERVFTVSIRDDSGIRKGAFLGTFYLEDYEANNFEFPEKQELKLKLKDMLEDEVDEKYYLTDSMIKTYQRDFGSKGKEIDLEHPIPTLTASMGTGGGNVPIIKSKCKRLEKLISNTEFEEGKVLNMDLYNQTTNENISQCLTEPHHNSQRLFDGLRIRKLTPKECWRLMGFDDEDFEKASQVNSNTQLYKQAGNSIVVNVLEAILNNLLEV